MDFFYFICGVGLFVFVWRMNATLKRERSEDGDRMRNLAGRISALELSIRALEAQPRSSSAESSLQKPVESREPETAAAAKPPSVAVPPIPPRAKLAEQTPSSTEVSGAHVDTTVSGAQPPQSAASASQFPSAASPATYTPLPGFSQAKVSFADRVKSSHDLEERLGTNWLNKLGVAILVLGISFFLAYEIKELGPAGKVLVGWLTGGLLLAAGIWLDLKDRYRIFARAGIGGGWALWFFTAYAMYHVPAALVLSSEAADLVLMLVVAAAMVVHTLRYRSQAVTGLAFLLAFLTVSISHSTVYSLSAGVILAAGLVVIVGRMQWFEMELLGIFATYLNHYLWLRPIIEPMRGRRHAFPEFAASVGILALCWLIFRLSYVFRAPGEKYHERISTAAALLNTTLLLALFKYQSAHPEYAFWGLLTIGALETLLSQLPISRRRRAAVIVLSTMGIVLLIAAFPFRYSGARLSVLWIMEAEALLLVGVWTKEIVFRRLGALAALLVCGQMISVEAARVFGKRMDDAELRPDFALAIIFVVAAAVLYANSHWVLRRWADVFAHEVDRHVMQRLSYVAALMLAVAAWIAFPETWTAVAWCALGLALAVAGRRFTLPELGYQGNALALASVVRVLALNLESSERFHGVSLRLVSVATVSALLYITSRWGGDADRKHGVTFGDRFFSFAYLADVFCSWSSSALLALLAWYELRSIGVANAWFVGGLVLLEVGLTRRNVSLRLQGYVAFLASFLRIFFVNLNADGIPGTISPRFYTVLPITIGFLYVYWRLHDRGGDLIEVERKWKAAEICCWLGTISVAALMRFELPADWVAAAWAALLFALLFIAWRSERPVFLYQGILLMLGVLFRTVLHNFYERSYFPAPAWETRWITVGAVVAILFATLPLTFRLRRKEPDLAGRGYAGVWQFTLMRPEQPLFFIATGLLTTLLAMEMRHGMVTLSWGLEGVAVFLLALWLGERSFRLTGLGLLLLCAGKILAIDVWRLDPRDRYLTFIVLGAALLLVSFLYTHNREKLRQYL
jgi:uncharacterized membrane protein